MNVIENIEYTNDELAALFDLNGFLVLNTVLYLYKGSSTEVLIPDGVTTIKESAFSSNNKIEKVVFPESVFCVEAGSFAQCKKLEEIVMSSQIKAIEERTFTLCSSLSSITLPKMLEEIHNYAFFRCYNLNDIQWNPNLKLIKNEAFSFCESLKSIKFKEGLEEIHYKAFYRCISLEKVSLPSTIKRIGLKAFFNCYNLKMIEYHYQKLIKRLSLGHQAFDFTKDFDFIDEGILDKAPNSFQRKYRVKQLAKWKYLSDLEKENFFTNIRKRKTLRNIVFTHNNILVINECLKICNSLNLDVLDGYITASIMERNTEKTAIFLEYKKCNYNSSEIEEFESNKELVEIGLEAPTLAQLRKNWTVSFVGKNLRVSKYKGLESEAILHSMTNKGQIVKSIGPNNNYGSFASLKKLIIEDGVEEIEPNTFFQCPIKELQLPESIKIIGANAFTESQLETINFPDSAIFGHQAFCRSEISEVILPKNLKEIIDYCFYQCRQLTNIVLPPNLEKLCYGSFYHCVSLSSVELPSSVTIIEDSAFCGCHNLSTVNLSSSLKNIGEYAFSRCNIEEVYIPDSIECIEPFAFSECRNLKKISLPSHLNITKESLNFYQIFNGHCEDLKISIRQT